MKRLAILFSLFVVCNCFASGKLSVQPQYYLKSQKVTPQFGVSIYEHLFLGLNYNGWTGMGFQPRVGEPSVMWVTSRHDIEKWMGDLGVSFGITLRHAEQKDLMLDNDQDVHIKLSYKLW